MHSLMCVQWFTQCVLRYVSKLCNVGRCVTALPMLFNRVSSAACTCPRLRRVRLTVLIKHGDICKSEGFWLFLKNSEKVPGTLSFGEKAPENVSEQNYRICFSEIDRFRERTVLKKNYQISVSIK